MGTPEFAVPSLRKLAVESSHRVVGVVTPPDRPKGRGLRVACSPVKIEALERGLPIFQPDDLLQSDFLSRLRTWGGDCYAVVGFRILPPEIFEMPSKGTINLHASLLPKYRGAAPIQWALMNGDEKTGVTTFFIERRVDTGDLILQKSVSIRRDEAAGELPGACEDAVWNASKFIEARLQAVSSRNMYSEHGLDARIGPDVGHVCQSFIVVLCCRPGSALAHAA